MPESEHDNEVLHVAIIDGIAYIRVIERGSFKVSTALKQFGIAAVDQGAEHIVFDLRPCVGMDSTFMGVVAALAFRLRQSNDGKIYMVGLNQRTRGLLSTLGLDQLVEARMADDIPEAFSGVLEKAEAELTEVDSSASRRETTEVMVEAHDALVELSEANAPRFKDVLTFLREDLEREQPEETT